MKIDLSTGWPHHLGLIAVYWSGSPTKMNFVPQQVSLETMTQRLGSIIEITSRTSHAGYRPRLTLAFTKWLSETPLGRRLAATWVLAAQTTCSPLASSSLTNSQVRVLLPVPGRPKISSDSPRCDAQCIPGRLPLATPPLCLDVLPLSRGAASYNGACRAQSPRST